MLEGFAEHTAALCVSLITFVLKEVIFKIKSFILIWGGFISSFNELNI